jgi:hypothetical protein
MSEMSPLERTDVGKNILEVTEEKRLRWFGHVCQETDCQ